MDREYQAHEFFCVNTEFRVLICQKCQCAVRQGQVKTHLSSTMHRIPSTWAEHIQNVIQQWDYIDEEPEVDSWPRQIDEPIPELAIYEDGILCQQCEVYTCRQIRTMKAHWIEAHNYRVQQGRGRPTATQAQTIQATITANTRPVSCQRIFAQGPGSHYIRVAGPNPHARPDAPVTGDAVCQLLQSIKEYQQQDQQAHETIIQAGGLDEATPWLNRTGWVRYLQGTPRQPLYDSTQRPAEDATGPEQAALAIWEAMERLAYVSQEIAKVCGHLLRIDIVRTMKDESPQKPLFAYLDPAAIKKQVAPWQEILMFFARTQVCFRPGVQVISIARVVSGGVGRPMRRNICHDPWMSHGPTRAPGPNRFPFQPHLFHLLYRVMY